MTLLLLPASVLLVLLCVKVAQLRLIVSLVLLLLNLNLVEITLNVSAKQDIYKLQTINVYSIQEPLQNHLLAKINCYIRLDKRPALLNAKLAITLKMVFCALDVF